MKICNKCNLLKDVSMFHKNSSMSDGLQSRCKECRLYKNLSDDQKRKQIEASSKWVKNHKSQSKEYQSIYSEKWKEKRRQYKVTYRTKNQDKYIIARKKDAKNSRDELRCSYVRRMMCRHSGHNPRDMPLELVELKIAQLKILREIKQMEKQV